MYLRHTAGSSVLVPYVPSTGTYRYQSEDILFFIRAADPHSFKLLDNATGVKIALYLGKMVHKMSKKIVMFICVKNVKTPALNNLT